MKSKFRSTVVTSIALLLTQVSACKSSSHLAEDAGSDILSTDGSYTPVVVVLGGFWSCGSKTASKNKEEWSPTETIGSAGSMIGIATRNLDTVKKAIKSDVDHFLSCYTPEIEISKINFINNVGENTGVNRTDLDAMIENLNKSLEKLNNPRVSVIGHSYGGWTAMKLGLKLTPKATLNTLITIDPISRVTCTPRNFIDNLNQKKTSGTGCQESPKDFSTQELETLAKRSAWYNYYQTGAIYLHSSEIGSPLLKEDSKITYVTKDDKLEAHIRFLKDDQFIEKITQTIVENMKK